VRELLAGVGDGLEVDDRDLGVLGDLLDDLVLAIDRPVLDLREGAQGFEVDVSCDLE
jgi:hypothetical protein